MQSDGVEYVASKRTLVDSLRLEHHARCIDISIHRPTWYDTCQTGTDAVVVPPAAIVFNCTVVNTAVVVRVIRRELHSILRSFIVVYLKTVDSITTESGHMKNRQDEIRPYLETESYCIWLCRVIPLNNYMQSRLDIFTILV